MINKLNSKKKVNKLFNLMPIRKLIKKAKKIKIKKKLITNIINLIFHSNNPQRNNQS